MSKITTPQDLNKLAIEQGYKSREHKLLDFKRRGVNKHHIKITPNNQMYHWKTNRS